MKSKNNKKTVLFIFGFFVIITMSIALLNTKAQPNKTTLGCHPEGYTISVNATQIEGEISSNHIIEVTGTGANIVVDVYAGALSNDEFIISPSNIIADNSPNDNDPAANSISVTLNITIPSQPGAYTLRILTRSSTLDGEDTAISVADIAVTVGTFVIPPTPPLELFFNHNNYYIGLVTVILLVIGLVVFQLNVKRKSESKIHGISMAAALTLTTINVFLIMSEALNFAFGSAELPIFSYIGQLSHIILGSVGYIAGIVVVVGTFTKVPISKMKISVYIMFLAWTFNFLFGIFVLNLGG